MKFYYENNYNNLLVTGWGSKIDFLNKFAEQHLSDVPVITINGYMNGITLKYILNKLSIFLGGSMLSKKKKGDEILDMFDEENEDEKKKNLVDEMDEAKNKDKVVKRTKIQQIEYIKRLLNDEDPDTIIKYPKIVLMIHNIDGKPLRTLESQQILSELALSKKVSIASGRWDFILT